MGEERRQKDLGCGAHIPLPKPRGREGQLGLEAPRTDSDLHLALVGSREKAWLGQVLGEGMVALFCCLGWAGGVQRDLVGLGL